MTQAAHHETNVRHMGLPLSHGKVAIWLFLVTEIMFFTALIGVYLLLRNGTPTGSGFRWPKPHRVHLQEIWGAVNTIVLIASSVTVVLAHHVALKGNFKVATRYIGATLALGAVFLGIKAYEYSQKIAHDILPGHVGELLPMDHEFAKEHEDQIDPDFAEKHPDLVFLHERHFQDVGMQYVERVRGQLKEITRDVTPENLDKQNEHVRACYDLKVSMEQGTSGGKLRLPLKPAEVGARVNE